MSESESGVVIVDFEPKYFGAFKQLNQEWISQYFKMEESDFKALDHAQEHILDKGGYILMALLNDTPVGACALIKMENNMFELAKMAVSPHVQGKGVGKLLGGAVIAKAKSLGADKLYLESNTILVPAISLYRKLGFVEVIGAPSPYERCNIHMELNLNE